METASCAEPLGARWGVRYAKTVYFPRLLREGAENIPEAEFAVMLSKYPCPACILPERVHY